MIEEDLEMLYHYTKRIQRNNLRRYLKQHLNITQNEIHLITTITNAYLDNRDRILHICKSYAQAEQVLEANKTKSKTDFRKNSKFRPYLIHDIQIEPFSMKLENEMSHHIDREVIDDAYEGFNYD